VSDRLLRIRERDDGSREVLVAYGTGGERWEPAATWYARHRLMTLYPPGTTLADALAAEGWTPPA